MIVNPRYKILSFCMISEYKNIFRTPVLQVLLDFLHGCELCFTVINQTFYPSKKKKSKLWKLMKYLLYIYFTTPSQCVTPPHLTISKVSLKSQYVAVAIYCSIRIICLHQSGIT